MLILNQITWNPDPEIFSLGAISVRYYGLSYTLTFFSAYYLLEKMFKRDKAPLDWLNKGFLCTIICVVIGGRLGHVLFYGWDYYSNHLTEILMFWRGGMASHGAAIGIVAAVFIYSKRVTKQSMLWTLDYAAVVVALGAVFIRLGNLMNSEIIGKVTYVPWAFRFVNARGVYEPWLPRHPTQLYEAVIYLITFLILMYMYWYTDARKRQGLLFGVILICVFATRIFIEFFKENQEAFEDAMILNIGQILSIPFAISGVYFVVRALKRPPADVIIPEADKE